MIIKTIRISVFLLVVFTIMTGVIYPLSITTIAQIAFPYQSNGSLIHRDGKIVGSELIGQWFNDPKYFYPRLSATSDHPYNAAYSGGSNYSVLNPLLIENAGNRLQALNIDHADKKIPSDLVTSSASGLDPHISIAAAELQKPRIAQARDISVDKVEQFIQQNTQYRVLGILGEPRVNVLELNLALDELE